MPLDTTIAARITDKSLDMIARVNGGLKPEIEDEPTVYLFKHVGTDNEQGEILAETDFDRMYEGIALPLQNDSFVHVRER